MTSEPSLPQMLLQRIARDYEEQPGLRLTPQEAQRLWGFDGPTCRAVLTALVDAGVLQRTSDGRFVRRRRRREDGEVQPFPAALPRPGPPPGGGHHRADLTEGATVEFDAVNGPKAPRAEVVRRKR